MNYEGYIFSESYTTLNEKLENVFIYAVLV